MTLTDEKTMNDGPASGAITYQRPDILHGAAMWELVNESGVLDLNSAYLYLILCAHFSGTCGIAECDNKVVGFVTAYLLPDDPSRLFVWQIGTDASMRGRGIATNLLLELLNRESLADTRYIEATISPSNVASETLFTHLAKRLGVDAVFSEYINSDMFPRPGHEDERLLRIGPFENGVSAALKNYSHDG
ncbi:MAG TPA: diaminobutyrate acetyltransferase [Gammaproteobacteria bacterium]|nr:diaminobutyrate acetyltransferase [Gammaproteobacteria bacterium]